MPGRTAPGVCLLHGKTVSCRWPWKSLSSRLNPLRVDRCSVSYWPGGNPKVSPKVNRRELLAGGSILGAAAAVSVLSAHAQAGRVEVGRFTRRTGVQGKMTGAQAAAAALRCHGVRCVFGIPGAQNNEFWDALKAASVPYLLVTHEASASVMADAAARATGEVGVFSVVPGPGLTNALTGIGEALYDSIPIVGIVTDIDRSPHAPIGQVHGLDNAAILRPVVKALIEVRHQAEIRWRTLPGLPDCRRR